MLKLINSSYRYFKVTYEKIPYRKAHVRKFTVLNFRGKTCNTITQASEHLRQFSSKKKKLRIKIPSLSSNEKKISNPMSESFQPTLNHVSYGGQFNITEDNVSNEEWQQYAGSGSTQSKGQATNIPQNFRFWEPVLTKSETTNGNPFKFKVVSYNVLAQYLLECHPYLYTNCSPRNLTWKYRSSRLYDEITNLEPDILCLQEVQVAHLDTFYSKFESLGYVRVFKQKTGHRQDGCAIYFKDSLFQLKDHISVEFYQPELPILNRDNIGIIVKLVPRNLPDTSIVVATTHLLYNPKRTDVRLAQIQVFLAEIDRFAYYNNGKESGHLPIILTGDFNSTPDSAVIKLLDRGRVSVKPFRDSSDWKRIGVTDNCQHLAVYLNRQEGRSTDRRTLKIYNSDFENSNVDIDADIEPPGCDYGEMFNSGVLGHSLKLISTYDKYKSNGESEASTFQDYWVTVDYIYFSCCSSLKLLERLRLPTAAECDVLEQLPNDVYGSDHIALAALFELKPLKCSL